MKRQTVGLRLNQITIRSRNLATIKRIKDRRVATVIGRFA